MQQRLCSRTAFFIFVVRFRPVFKKPAPSTAGFMLALIFVDQRELFSVQQIEASASMNSATCSS